MQRYAGTRVIRLRPALSRRQAWHHGHPRDNRPAPATYVDGVVPPPRVAKARFTRFVDRVLADARDRGMTDEQIEAATGVGASTFHRWRRGDYKRAPELGRIRAFCVGLGVDPTQAMAALGLSAARDPTEPEPPLDPDIRIILRALTDPNVTDEQKAVIRGLLKMLAQQASMSSRGRIRRELEAVGNDDEEM